MQHRGELPFTAAYLTQPPLTLCNGNVPHLENCMQQLYFPGRPRLVNVKLRPSRLYGWREEKRKCFQETRLSHCHTVSPSRFISGTSPTIIMPEDEWLVNCTATDVKIQQRLDGKKDGLSHFTIASLSAHAAGFPNVVQHRLL